MDPKQLLQNKNVLIGIGAGLAVIILLFIVLGTQNSPSSSETGGIKQEKIKDDVKLLTTSDVGKVLEIQALLAREGITVRQGGKGNKIDLWLYKDDGITTAQRDTAIITIVKSGIMDRNIGLEIFDKGDFTSSREDKRIRLARAVNGELARLIKKIPGIEDASVFVAIPKDTIFTSLKQPTTATVQLVLAPSADRLERNIIRAIKNLLLGSIEDLNAENISITDTNGNVYSSIMSATDDMMKLLEDQDSYMKKKIIAQLDKLIGKENYVVTVSTYLRESPSKTAKITYNPDKSAKSTVGTEQIFTEKLGDQSEDKSKLSSGVSAHLPKGLSSPESSSSRNYNREAKEYNYKVDQTSTSELKKPGMLEEISIAVTVSRGSMPSSMTIEEMKELIARTASPKARPENVSIAFSDKIKPYLIQERPVQLPQPEQSGNPWWTVAAVLAAMMFAGLVFIYGRAKTAAKKHEKEIESLMEIAQKQEKALADANNRALQLQEAQQKLHQQLTTNQQQLVEARQAPPSSNIQEPISEVTASIQESDDEEALVTTLRSWIESS